MPAGHRFDMDAAMGMHPAWRSALPRIAQRQALIRLGQQQFPNASGRQRARNTVAFVAEYKRARWSTDRRMQRQPDGAAGEAFNILTLAPSIPSPNTLRKYMPGATTPPPAAPTYSPGSRQQEKPVAVMARIRNGLSSTEPAAVSVPKLDDDPRYAEASALLGAINGRVARLGRERDRLILEGTISPAGRSPRSTPTIFYGIASCCFGKNHRSRALMPATSTDAPTPAIDRAMRILEEHANHAPRRRFRSGSARLIARSRRWATRQEINKTSCISSCGEISGSCLCVGAASLGSAAGRTLRQQPQNRGYPPVDPFA